MEKRYLIEFTVDTASAAAELTEMITTVLAVNPGRELEILRTLDEEIGLALSRLEESEEAA